jgi:peptidoglycan/LPS O-acetylase OafA/YrhL
VTYRPDIDGLRAVAVLSVVAYHYGALLPGGFVGVDVFFVISGYLITRQIVDGLATGTFTFRGFYARRARRILPALFVTMIACFGAGFLLFPPHQFAQLAASVLAAAFSVSNIYFWQSAGYFDAAAITKPLLHTWSLSIEEQFYLVYPAALVLAFRAWRTRGIVALLSGAGLVSFALALSFQDGSSVLVAWSASARRWIADGQAAIFYFAPLRAFEFAIGGLLLWAPPLKRAAAREALTGAGLALIAWSAYAYSDKLLYPSWYALAPCAGAALAIHAGSARYASWVLNNPVAVRIGLVSYSLYLVHWPVLVFAQHVLFRKLTPYELLAAGLASYLIAEAMYRFVERPFRNYRRYPGARILPYGAALAASALLVVGMSHNVRANGGWTWRLNEAALRLASGTGWQSPHVGRLVDCSSPCEFGDPGGPRVLIVGDSHADHYTKTLNRLGHRYRFHFAYGASCFFGATMISRPSELLAKACAEAKAMVRSRLRTTDYQAIIVAHRWEGYRSILVRNGERLTPIHDLDVLFGTMLADIEALYAGFGGPVVIVGYAPDTNTKCYLRPMYFDLPCPEIPYALDEHDAFKRAFSAFRKTTRLDVSFVDPVDVICPGRSCRLVDDGGQVLYTDSHHLSIFGAALIVPQMLAAIAPAAAAARAPAVAEAERH